MKIRGYLKGKGKLGNIVLSTVAGETIARDYNPEVANPNTAAQVEQRCHCDPQERNAEQTQSLREGELRAHFFRTGHCKC